MNASNTTRSILFGISCMLAAAISWGGMFPVAKATLQFVDPFFLTLIRYSITSLFMLALLWLLEGRAALQTEGQALTLFLYGCAGFCGFGLLVFTGLRASTPAHGAILVALMPLLTALVNAVNSHTLPPRHTQFSIVVALAGVGLVVSNGHPAALLESQSIWSDVLILAGVLSWVIYTLGARKLAGWSPLRYSTLTVAYGVIGIALCTAIAVATGAAHVPAMSHIVDTAPHFVYIVVFASVIAVIGWNEGIRRIGPVNGVLFINFVPITAFVIQALQGQSFGVWELAGAALVISALLINNLMQRQPVVSTPAATRTQGACGTAVGLSAYSYTENVGKMNESRRTLASIGE